MGGLIAITFLPDNFGIDIQTDIQMNEQQELSKEEEVPLVAFGFETLKRPQRMFSTIGQFWSLLIAKFMEQHNRVLEWECFS